MLFLLVGFVTGSTGLLPLSPGDPLEIRLAELALFVVLFTDSMRLGVRDLASAWRLPGRALILGLPLTPEGFIRLFTNLRLCRPAQGQTCAGCWIWVNIGARGG